MKKVIIGGIGDLGSGLGLNQISSPHLHKLPDIQDEGNTKRWKLRLKLKEEPGCQPDGPMGVDQGRPDRLMGLGHVHKNRGEKKLNPKISSHFHIGRVLSYKWKNQGGASNDHKFSDCSCSGQQTAKGLHPKACCNAPGGCQHVDSSDEA